MLYIVSHDLNDFIVDCAGPIQIRQPGILISKDWLLLSYRNSYTMTSYECEDKDLKNLSSKTVLIIGAVTGIGRAAVDLLVGMLKLVLWRLTLRFFTAYR